MILLLLLLCNMTRADDGSLRERRDAAGGRQVRNRCVSRLLSAPGHSTVRAAAEYSFADGRVCVSTCSPVYLRDRRSDDGAQCSHRTDKILSKKNGPTEPVDGR